MSHTKPPNWFDQTPDSAYLRERQLVGDNRDPNSPRLLPVSRSTLWRMVKSGRFPAPHKLGLNTTAWRCGDVRRYLQESAV
jgi:predicted DNA-binding transcriptional regulator AlpA